jgi:hypothetical protein
MSAMLQYIRCCSLGNFALSNSLQYKNYTDVIVLWIALCTLSRFTLALHPSLATKCAFLSFGGFSRQCKDRSTCSCALETFSLMECVFQEFLRIEQSTPSIACLNWQLHGGSCCRRLAIAEQALPLLLHFLRPQLGMWRCCRGALRLRPRLSCGAHGGRRLARVAPRSNPTGITTAAEVSTATLLCTCAEAESQVWSYLLPFSFWMQSSISFTDLLLSNPEQFVCA